MLAPEKTRQARMWLPASHLAVVGVTVIVVDALKVARCCRQAINDGLAKLGLPKLRARALRMV
jgi:hypothetical protein